MNLIKQYIIQSISAASNNLRLNTQKIEVVALLREFIAKSDDLEADIKKMKKITELSTLAIRLNEVHNYLTQAPVDYFKVSDKFRSHSQYLIKDLSQMLDLLNPQSLKVILSKLKPTVPELPDPNAPQSQNINIDLSKRKIDDSVFVKSESDILKEKYIMEDDKEDEDLLFQNYEETILKAIKPIDNILKNFAENNFDSAEIMRYADVMKKNEELSAKVGFEIIANMHRIIGRSLQLIYTRDLMPGKEIIESIRSCLIVIVAVVKGKEIDITNYLNKAEEFGKKIQMFN
jgi:hypothetical protein